MTTDLITAIFESIAVVSNLLDILALKRDKQVKGYNIWMGFYWLVYGLWFIVLYGGANLPISCAVIVVWVSTYAIKMIMAFYYRFFANRFGNNRSTCYPKSTM